MTELQNPSLAAYFVFPEILVLNTRSTVALWYCNVATYIKYTVYCLAAGHWILKNTLVLLIPRIESIGDGRGDKKGWGGEGGWGVKGRLNHLGPKEQCYAFSM